MQTAPSLPPSVRRSRLGRFGALAVLAVIFTLAATMFSPFTSSARSRPASDMPPIVRSDGQVLVGRTLGRDHRLLAYASGSVITYTVTSNSGRVLARDLAADDVYRMFPDLDPAALHMDAVGGPLMMADPDH